MTIITVERTSPATGKRIRRSFVSAARAAEFFNMVRTAGHCPVYVETPDSVREMLASLKGA